MRKYNLIKKGLVVAVILLFIGLAFAPSINANIRELSTDDVLEETDILQLESELQRIRAYIEMQSDEDCDCSSESGSDGDYLFNICLFLALWVVLPLLILMLISPFEGKLWYEIMQPPVLLLGTILDCFWMD